MRRKGLLFLFPLLVLLFVDAGLMMGQELKPILLPKPQLDGGRPLMQVLKDRRSSREFGQEKVPIQVLSNLLWAAFGINGPDPGKRTAPSARHWQETDIYVATSEGLYLYDAKAHQLNLLQKADIRAITGTQPYVKEAPINLVYVVDYAKTGKAAEEERQLFCPADVGFISENVYLFCASEGLATVVRGLIDRPALAKAMQLRPDQKIILSQSIGYPKR
ncbi:MAG TPA: SagB/ThcOx family dehydrogenase [Thermodesulfobacteriota bacterium]|nr:SagB/ThcOx family dehydrogenase [Thermodesulfobacteriota bacterium]